MFQEYYQELLNNFYLASFTLRLTHLSFSFCMHTHIFPHYVRADCMHLALLPRNTAAVFALTGLQYGSLPQGNTDTTLMQSCYPSVISCNVLYGT